MSKQSECLRIRYILLGPGKNTDFLQEGKETYRLLKRGYQSGRRTDVTDIWRLHYVCFQ